MSLRVWLPLNGNTNNQGCSDVEVTNSNATSSTEGKIGGCYSFNGTNARLSDSVSRTYSYPISVCCWVCPTNATSTTTQYIISVNQDSSGTAGHLIGIGLYGAKLAMWAGGAYTASSTTLTNNTWYHLAATIDSNNNRTLYLNGQAILSGTCGEPPSSKWLTIGARSNSATGGVGGASYYYAGKINDFRLYDHCLSAKEVKEISKGLVVHYALDGGGRGLDNLGDFQSVANKWTNDGMSSLANYADSEHGNVLKMTNSSANVRIYRNVTNVWKSGQSYTVSFLARSATAGTVVNMSRSIADFSSNFTLTTSWKKYVGTINSTATADGGTLSFRVVSASAEVYLTNVKLENGTVNTPYIPGSGDPNYSTMGYGDNKEYDISGYGNHATRSGVSYETNSPKYSIGTLFASGNHITTTLNSAGYSNTFTFAWWGKYTNYSSHMMWGYSNGNRLNLYMSGGNFYWNTGDGNGNPFGVSASTYGDDKWHHFAVTGDGTTVKLYIDGIFKGNASAFKAITGTSLIFNGWDTGTGYNFNGKLSDFRLYSTTLSADDVKELYQVSSSICNNGTVMCSDFLES